MDIKLTPLQAFFVMQNFLEMYFKKTSSDSLGALLSCMQFLEDDQTADPALWEDWITIVNGETEITPLQAFDAMRTFLENYYKSSASRTIKKIFEDIKTSNDNRIINHEVWNNWLECIIAVYE